MQKRIFAASGLAASLLVPQLHAQGQATAQSSRGLTKSLPVAMSLADGLPTSDSGVHLKEEGRATSFPNVWSAGAYPNPGGGLWVNYSKAAMFGSWSDAVVVNGHSSGNAIIPPLDHNGVPRVREMGTWMAVVVSVTDGSIGGPTSLTRMRVNGNMPGTGSRTSPGSDLIGYYYGESRGLPTGMAGATLIEQVAEGMGMPAAGQDMDAVDFGLGVNTLNTATSGMLLFPNRTQYYFSLSSTCIPYVNQYAANVGQQFAIGHAGNEVPANAATVYVINWNGSSWSTPQEYLTPSDLGLVQGQHDLDAVEVDPLSGVTVFSVVNNQGPTLPSQLMVHHFLQSGGSATYPLMAYDNLTSTTPKLVESKTGTTGDTSDADGVCIIDPEAYELDNRMGIAVGGGPGADTLKGWMGLSMVKTSKGYGNNASDKLTLEVSGWGASNPTKGYEILYYSYDYDPHLTGMNGTWSYLATQSRNPHDFTLEFELEKSDLFFQSTVYIYAEHKSYKDFGSSTSSWISGIHF